MNTFDAQAALGFVIAQTAHIEQSVYQMKYADIQYPGLIPVDLPSLPIACSIPALIRCSSM